MIFAILLRAAMRSTQFLLLLLLGILLASALRLYHGRDWHLQISGQASIRWWMQRMTRLLGIRITQYGTPLTCDVLQVANHISFLDILVISSVVPVRFLSKHSVRYWPIIGYLTQLSGTVFIKRRKRRQVVQALGESTQALRCGRPLLVFPEGTTSLGAQVAKFHSGLFQAAIENAIPVQPLTLHYRRNGTADRYAAYIDQDNFLLSLLRLMAQPSTTVHLRFAAPIDSHGRNRQQLVDLSHARVSADLQWLLQHADNPPGFDLAIALAMPGECES